MKNRRIEKFTAVILALLLLVSCSPKSTNGANSTLGENETHNNVIANQQTNTETNEKTEVKENDMDSENKSEVQKPVSSKPSEKDETTSRLTVERPDSSNTETSSRSPLLESDFPFYMPKDNPEPISIHGANAATPTPFSYTGFLGGEEMEFNLNKRMMGSWGFNRMAAVIKTYDELEYVQSLEEDEWRPLPITGNSYTRLYDESFFKDMALIEVFMSGLAHEWDIPKVLKNEDQLCVYYKTTSVSRSDAAARYRTFIEVSKEDLASVKTLVIYYEKYW